MIKKNTKPVHALVNSNQWKFFKNNSDNNATLNGKQSLLPLTVTLEQTYKCRPERSIEYCIYNGVNGRGYVAQPQAGIDHMLGYLALGTGGKDYIQYEERWPAQNECEKHQTQYFGSLLFGGNCIGGEAVALVTIVEEAARRTKKTSILRDIFVGNGGYRKNFT